MRRSIAVLLLLLRAIFSQAAPTIDRDLTRSGQPSLEVSESPISPTKSSPTLPLPNSTPTEYSPKNIPQDVPEALTTPPASPIRTESSAEPPTPPPLQLAQAQAEQSPTFDDQIPQPPASPTQTESSAEPPTSPQLHSAQPPVEQPPVKQPATFDDRIPECPSEVPPCPTECQPEKLPVPVPPSQPPAPPPKKKTGWKNGVLNILNVCYQAIIHSITDLVVVTGERPPKRPRKSSCFLSFSKYKPNTKNNDDSGQEDRQRRNINCVFYKDYRTTAPRGRVATCVTDSSRQRGNQCNFCCVGNNVVDCSNCLTINCNPTINCCSCNINVTIVNNNS